MAVWLDGGLVGWLAEAGEAPQIDILSLSIGLLVQVEELNLA